MFQSEMNLKAIGVSNEDLLFQVFETIVEDESIVQEPIPIAMVKGLDGTLIKQDEDFDTREIQQSDLPKVMPIIAGIADSVCYRWYPSCEVV